MDPGPFASIRVADSQVHLSRVAPHASRYFAGLEPANAIHLPLQGLIGQGTRHCMVSRSYRP